MQLIGYDSTIYIELLGPTNIYLGVGIQVLSALLLGGFVGYDREKKMKAAGLKTNILICIGACLYTTMSLVHLQNTAGTPDPNRVAAQIVSGIGFLGAGAIIQSRGNIIGLTTAATIWVVAAIGYTVGVGYPFSAALFSLTVLTVLKLINPIYHMLEKQKDQRTFRLDTLSRGSIKKTVKDIIFSETLDILELYEETLDKKRNIMVTTAIFNAHPRMMERICGEIKTGVKVEKVNYHIYLEEAENTQVHYPRTSFEEDGSKNRKYL